MISLGLFVFLQISVVVRGTPHPNNGHTTQKIPSGGEVDAAIVNINTLYTDALCLELLLVDCATHVTKGDEQVCGSNGVTYNNHCRFTHAVCETLYDDHKITLKSHGACPNTTAPPSNVATVTVAASATTAVTHGTGSGHTTDATTTSAPSTTTSAPTKATPDPIASIVQNVFCSNLGSISCSGGFDVICGSDGNYYPNQCELSKAKCHDNALTIVTDISKCAASVSGGK
ncbi:tomoregulin-2-like [Dreissena polymorpha]|uniref:tomoregulin-2-like n=1 Tax=Dreissena polymorpha TaxID=45954 RepID=UPI002264AD80|nr:tomoregulin-2-like [Dreissena polymorpha]